MTIAYGFDTILADVRSVVTIGSFDGVHSGHKVLLSAVRRMAECLDAESVVVTFDPHPRIAMGRAEGMGLLTTIEERALLLEREGVDRMVVVRFDEEFRSQSCGQVLKGYMEARIADANSAGVGEIQVRGEHVMAGYYKNEEATAQSFTEDGWLRTGDLGTIDEDGFIYIKGRCKTMLLGPSGQNIYPEEIEAKINNMPYVLESLVLQKDTRLVALVCPDFEAVDADKLSQEQLEVVMEENRKLVNAELAAYEQINELRIYTHEFEKTPKKSIKRFLYEA